MIATSEGGAHSVLRPPAALVRSSASPPSLRKASIATAHRVGVAALVVMAAALEQGDPPAFDLADHEPPGVAGDGGDRKAGDVEIGDADRFARLVGEGAEPGAEHDRERRQRGKAAGLERGDRGVEIRFHEVSSRWRCEPKRHAGKCSGPNDCGSSSPSVNVAPHALRPGDMDRRCSVGEFADALAAAAAGRAERLAVADDQDLGDAPLAGERHRGDRAGLGAGALRIGGVLDIAAGIDRAAFGAQRGADVKARIGRIGVGLRRLGRGEQLRQAPPQRSLT